jgi:quercetin dioxygenase-like cupin family protein
MSGKDAPLPGLAFPEFVGRLPVHAGGFAARDCEVLFASYPADTAIEAHDHDTDNWGVITRGRRYLTVADEAERAYGPGDWYALAPGVRHSACFEEDTAEIEFWFAAGVMAGQP